MNGVPSYSVTKRFEKAHDEWRRALGLPAVNRYEAAIPGSPDRPYLPAFVRDARFDANSFTRWELARKARYERRNNWLMKRLQDVDVKYTVGPHGHVVIPASSDADWNAAMLEDYTAWCEAPFRDSALPMFQGDQLARKEMHIDGEVFENCTYLKMPGMASIPAIELVESHRVSSPGVEYEYPELGKDIVDGVQLSRDEGGELYGKPGGYHVRLGMDGEKWSYVRAFDPKRPIAGGMIHVCDPDRIGMARMVSEYAPVLNEISDLFLLWNFELDRAKANSEVAAIYQSLNGELPDTFSGSGIQGLPAGSLPGMGVPGGMSDEELRKKLDQFRKVISAKWLATKPGETITFPENPSPSAATQWLWRFFIERVAIARNIPMILVLPESIQGTVSRAVLDDAQIGFIGQFAINARAARMKYRFYASWARYNRPKLADAPADWDKCHVVPPPAINVDFGRNMNAMLAGIAFGIYDYDDIIGKDGSTAETRFLKKGRNILKGKIIAKKLTEEAAKLGHADISVKAEEIMGNIAEVAQMMAQVTSTDDGEEEEPPKPGEPEPRTRKAKPERA